MAGGPLGGLRSRAITGEGGCLVYCGGEHSILLMQGKGSPPPPPPPPQKGDLLILPTCRVPAASLEGTRVVPQAGEGAGDKAVGGGGDDQKDRSSQELKGGREGGKEGG